MNCEIRKYKNSPIKGIKYLKYRDVDDINLAIDIRNKIVQQALQDFVNAYKDIKSVRNIRMRVFLKGFKDSLEGFDIDENNWFCMDTFYKQYKFYNELDLKLRENKILSGNEKVKNKLVAFYRFINVGLYSEKYKSDFTNEFIDAINSKNFYRVYEAGYKFIYYDSLEDVPKEDKICILPTKKTIYNANSFNTKRQSFDFSVCSEVYRESLKIFIWNNWNGIGSMNHYKRLIEFLNLSVLQQYSKNVVRIEKSNKEFTEEFLWNYRITIKNEVENTATVKSIFKIVRKFLNYYKKKYNVSRSDIDILNLAKLDNYNGGKIISEKDLNLIYGRFRDKEKENSKLRIYTIVFEIFLTTKFRIGEILNFRRTWLEPLDNNTYKLKYLGKTTEQCTVEEVISEETANLLMEAIELTKDIVSEKALCGEFIFVENYNTNHIVDCKRISFSYEFRKILEELSDELDNSDYKPNNIRHTFINNVYEEGIKQNFSLERIALIAGNSYKVAKKHYRDKSELLDYLEAVNGICIANVDINGKIVDDEDSATENKVKNGLGNCTTHGCKFEIGECLICKNFVTFTNREKDFEEQIKKIDEMLSNVENKEEIDELVAYKKLVLRYLYEIKLLKER